MRKSYSLLVCAAIIVLIPLAAYPHSDGPPDGYTGAPNEQTCVSCHNTYELNSGRGSLHLEGLPITYAVGVTYELSVRVVDPDASRWGFELTIMDQDRRRAGEITVT